MYADLGPGQTIDLDRPSHDRMDLIYSHAYVAMQRRRDIEFDQNLYEYVDGRPSSNVDPYGLAPVSGIPTLIGPPNGDAVNQNLPYMSLSTQDALRRLQAEERWRDIAELHRLMDEQRGSFDARAKGDPERTRLLNDARAVGLLGPVEHILFVADQTPGMLRLYPRIIQMFYGGDEIVCRCAGWTRVTAEDTIPRFL